MAENIAAQAQADAGAAVKGRGKLLMLLIVAMLALTTAGAGAWWWRHASTHTSAAKSASHPAPPLYLALDPPFVVNFESEQLVRFLQITVQLMSRDPATIELLKSNDPVIRNDLLMLFANQKYTVLATRDGKEALRGEALASVRKVLTAGGGHPERLEAVYFTSFVMQ
jgi:flagellar protein FliL